MIFETVINGIPCQCKVIEYSPTKSVRVARSGYKDIEPPEPGEFVFELLDRTGHPAPWLEKYITPQVKGELEEEYQAACLAEKYDILY